VSGVEATQRRTEDAAIVAAARAGDESAFTALVEQYRRELQVHCYRMLGSFEDSEDLVQETLLRAWRKRESFEGRSTFRAWLYRIATNACLDALERVPHRVLPSQLGPAMTDPSEPVLPAADLPWLQPYPDHLLDPIAPSAAAPDVVVVARETIEIAFLAAIQLLPPKQRAVLVLRDVLDWSAKEIASLLEVSVASVNGALQRARATLKTTLPARRLERARRSDPSEEERAVLRRFMDALERVDANAVAELLREDARGTMPPIPSWHDGREAIFIALSQSLEPDAPNYVGHFRLVPTRANMQPAAAAYLRTPGGSEYQAFALDVLRIEDGKVVEITAFLAPELFPAFGLPPTLR
jgi:RNA polymerase sigma-70 factor, ECF subfamily